MLTHKMLGMLILLMSGSILLLACQTPWPLPHVATSPNKCLCHDHVCASSAAFAPDTREMVTGHTDGRIHLWDVATGELVATQQMSTERIVNVSFSPDGLFVLSNARGGTTTIWNRQTDTVIQQFDWPEPLVPGTGASSYAVFSPDGQTVLTTGPNAYLWDIATGQLVTTLEGHTRGIMGVAFSPDGTSIATSSSDNTVRLWDTTTGGFIKEFRGHINDVHHVEFTPDGRQLVSNAADGTVRVWDIETGKQIQLFDETLAIFEGVVSPNSQHILAGGVNGVVVVWERDTGTQVTRLNPQGCHLTNIAISADGAYVLTTSQMPAAKLWETATWTEVRAIEP